MSLDDIELHDALLRNMVINHKEKKVSIEIAYFKNENDKERSTAEIWFNDVDTLSQISDLLEMENNAFAGNISYWIPSLGPGTTYIYLVQGCISIKSREVQFK